jgi:hypothetical protein
MIGLRPWNLHKEVRPDASQPFRVLPLPLGYPQLHQFVLLTEFYGQPRPQLAGPSRLRLLADGRVSSWPFLLPGWENRSLTFFRLHRNHRGRLAGLFWLSLESNPNARLIGELFTNLGYNK